MMSEHIAETAQHTFTRPIANGTTYTATVSEAPGHPGYIEVTTDMALSLLAQAEALRTAARTFVTEMGDTWGGESQWLTTGSRVAEVVACVLREMAADLENECGLTGSPAPRCPTCIHPEGYDRLSGPCPTCDGDVVSSPGPQS